MRRRFLLVHNPTAGRRGRTLAHDVVVELERNGATVTSHVNGPETLPALLKQDSSFDAVVAAGGDGTIRALAAAAEVYDLPVGVVPMGTGNVLSHEIGLPRTAAGLAGLLRSGPARRFAGAHANGEPFFLMAGIGFDGEVIRRLGTPLKRLVGKVAYAAPVLKTLASAAPALEVEIDGASTHSAQWVVAANARRYGGSFIVAPSAGLDQPGLVAVLMQADGSPDLLRQLLALSVGRLDHAPGVSTIPCSSLTVRSATPVASQIDGDPFVMTPLTITAGGVHVRLIVPESYARSGND